MVETTGGDHTRCASLLTLTCQSAVLALAGLYGCASTEQTIGLVTAAGAQAPAHEVEQIYYLGIFDPHEQLKPPLVYRVRVHGQASLLNRTNFASGWVPAVVVDSLGSSYAENNGGYTVNAPTGEESSVIETGRRLMLFGPEGFREAPKDHRLVIVMSASPENYFNAVNQVLGEVSAVKAELRNEKLDRRLFETLVRLRSEEEGLESIGSEVRKDLGP